MKSFFLPLILFCTIGFINSANGQVEGAKKFVLFEHFTNTSCGPCATQNPVFQAFYEQNKNDARHLSMHTSWPGSSDPMYQPVSAESAAFVTYYGVTGVPDMFANGTGIGSPASANEGMLNTAASPIRIIVSETSTPPTRNITVKVETVGDLPDGNYVIKVAAIEGEINYSSAPGSNGETEFHNVFRKWIANAEAFTPAAKDESVEMSYSYDVDSTWQEAEMYALAYIVNTGTKEVINTGTVFDPNIEVLSFDDGIKQSSGTTAFSAFVINTSENANDIKIELTSDQPADWSSSFTYDGATYTDSVNTTMANGEKEILLNVTPGATAYIGRYTLTVSSEDAVLTKQFIILHNIEDVVVAKTYPNVDLAIDTENGLVKAQNEKHGTLSEKEFLDAVEAEATSTFNNVYLNIGWTFPAFTDDFVSKLTPMLDNGVNLFLSGQDIGWDVASGHASSNGTALQKSFYSDYLHAQYDDDGAAAQNSFTMVDTDPIFGNVAGSGITNVYGGTNLYPDHLSPVDDAATVFATYNDDGGMGLRAEGTAHKIVYMGIGIEQVTDNDVAEDIIKLSHDWFYGIISGVEFDHLLNEALNQNTPNPADEYTTIQIGHFDNHANLELLVYEVNGTQVINQPLKGSTIELATDQLPEGMYYYVLKSSEGQSQPKKMVIMH